MQLINIYSVAACATEFGRTDNYLVNFYINDIKKETKQKQKRNKKGKNDNAMKKKKNATQKDFEKRAVLDQQLNDDPGNVMLTMEYIDLLNSYNWFPEMFEENDKVGIKDITGEILVPAIFDDLAYSSSAIKYQIAVAAKLNGKWGLVSTNGAGAAITGFEFDYIAPISGPVTAVKKGGKWGYIFEDGRFFTEIGFDEICLVDSRITFINGWSAFKKDGLWGVTDGTSITAAEFDEVDIMNFPGPVMVVKNGVSGFIDSDCNFTTDEDEAYWYADFD